MNNIIFNGMNYIKKNLHKIILAIFTFIWPVLSFAQVKGDAPVVRIENPLLHAQTINELIKTILEGVIKIGMPIIVLAIIYSGFLFVSAQGFRKIKRSQTRPVIYFDRSSDTFRVVGYRATYIGNRESIIN